MAAIGVNVAWDGSHTADSLRAIGVTWVRLAYRSGLDITHRLAEYRAAGIAVLLVFDRDSVDAADPGRSFTEARARYSPYVDAWQIGNEPDGTGPSSWSMTQAEFVALGKIARQVLRYRVIVAGGMVSGDPNWLIGQDLGWCDVVAVHPYLKDATPENDLPDVWLLVHEYAALGKQVWVTEWGWWGEDRERGEREIRDMMTWAAATSDVAVFCYFCFVDTMVPPFGLYDDQGQAKPAVAPFSQAARQAVPVALPTPSDVPPFPIPTPDPTPWDGLDAEDASLLDFWMSVRGTPDYAPGTAISDLWATDPYRFGPPVGPERYTRTPDGAVSMAMQAFVNARLRWAAGDAAAAVADD